MKLYTEEQVKKAWNAAYTDALAIDEEDYKPKFYNDFIKELTPIELPSDKEIDKAILPYMDGWAKLGFIEGAKWMRDKIQVGEVANSNKTDVSSSLLSYDEATALCLKTKWKVTPCISGEQCWCRLIVPEIEIEDKDGNEIYIAGSGCVPKVYAEHIVKLHNQSLNCC